MNEWIKYLFPISFGVFSGAFFYGLVIGMMPNDIIIFLSLLITAISSIYALTFKKRGVQE